MTDKMKGALKTLITAVLSAIGTFLVTVCLNSCSSMDFELDKLSIHSKLESDVDNVTSGDLVEQTFKPISDCVIVEDRYYDKR